MQHGLWGIRGLVSFRQLRQTRVPGINIAILIAVETLHLLLLSLCIPVVVGGGDGDRGAGDRRPRRQDAVGRQVDAEVGSRRRDVQAGGGGGSGGGCRCGRRVAHADSPVPAAHRRPGEYIVDGEMRAGCAHGKLCRIRENGMGSDCVR